MLSKKFAKDAGERAVKTFSELFLSLMAIGSHFGITTFHEIIAISCVGAFVSLPTSVLSSLRGDPSSASLVK